MRLLRRAAAAMSAGVARAMTTSRVTGLAPGPFAVGVRTIQLTDESRQEDGAPRQLQTEVWYPALDNNDKPSTFSESRGRPFNPWLPEFETVAGALSSHCSLPAAAGSDG